jgi:hypothetical protein
MNERLRVDPAIPAAAGLTEAELEDHQATFLADIAQALVLIGQTGADPRADARRLRHPAADRRAPRPPPRAAGVTEEGLRREFEILREALDEALHAATRAGDHELDAVREVLRSLVERAEEISIKGMRSGASAAE